LTDPEHRSLGQDEFLTLLIGAAPGSPERLLLIGRPRDGIVRVREWTSDTLNTEGDDYDIEIDEMLGQIEQAYKAHLTMNQEIYKLRRWLEG
jgi:hypothetical protein